MEIKRDWECEGALRVVGGSKTIERYLELRNKKVNVDLYSFHIFCAFTDSQYEKGKKDASIKDGEKIYSFGAGIYGTKDGFKLLEKEYKKIDEQIRNECDPQEVYVEEYNNHECMFGYDGDEEAIKIIGQIFGWSVASSIKRFSVCKSLEEISSSEG